jgi:hypothetical protein
MLTRRLIQHVAVREVFAVVAIAAFALSYLAVIWETRPPSISVGRVVGFGILDQEGFGGMGTTNRATVDLPGIGIVVVSLPNGAPCSVGAAIEIEEAHALLGSRFRPGPRNCFTPAAKPH